jgi:predicted dehydrogenase
MVKRLKFGVIGLGKMGILHLRNCKLLPNALVVSAADVSKRNLEKAMKIGVKESYENYNELLGKSAVDAVIIALPNFLHKESVFAAAEAGKHIFVEKPLALSSKDCEEIGKKVESCGVHLMVGHNYRFFDNVQKLRKLYDEGSVGDVEISTFELILNGPFSPSFNPVPVSEWYFDKTGLGMGCLDSGVHLIDLFQWFFGEPLIVYANLGYRFNLPYEDSAIVMLQSKKQRTKGVMNVGWFSKMIFPKFNFRVIFHGTNGFLSTDQFAPNSLFLHAAKEAFKNTFRRLVGMNIHPLTYTYYYSSYYEELKYFCETIEKDEEPGVGIKDATIVAKTIEQIYAYKE